MDMANRASSLLTTDEAAALIAERSGRPMSRQGVLQAIGRGTLIAVKRGRDNLIERHEVERYASNRPRRGRRWPPRSPDA
jgi:hypothetical protein